MCEGDFQKSFMRKRHFTYKRGQLCCEKLPLARLARQHGTPFYVYSRESIVTQWAKLENAFSDVDHLVCYSVKANSNHEILKTLFSLGAGADVVSGGELWRALKAGCNPQKTVFSGVGKTAEEIGFALQKKILQFNVESEGELSLIEKIATKLKCRAPIALRVNPDVDARTHPYISTGLTENKFGIDFKQATALYLGMKKRPRLDVVGIDCHIGSQLTEISPYEDAFRKLRQMVLELRDAGIFLENIDVGGGLGIRYRDEPEINVAFYGTLVEHYFSDLCTRIILEPGRYLLGHAGALVAKVLHTKSNSTGKHFTIIDAGFNDLKRPMLYQAYHGILPVKTSSAQNIRTDVVGPICETTDTFAVDRVLPKVNSGDYLAIMDCGAYGASMASFYNSRPRPLEILVSGSSHRVIKRRETMEEIAG